MGKCPAALYMADTFKAWWPEDSVVFYRSMAERIELVEMWLEEGLIDNLTAWALLDV